MRCGWDQKPSQTGPPLTYSARSAATVAAPSSTHLIPDPFRRSPMILQPASVGPLAFSRILYGATHRYGTSALGTETTLEAFWARSTAYAEYA